MSSQVPVRPVLAAKVASVPPQTRVLTQSEAAEYLRVSVKTLQRETRAGRVPASRIGRRLLYTVDDLDEYLRRMRVHPGEDSTDPR